jgi:hypothetical protein
MQGERFMWEGGGRSRGVLSWESGARCLVRGGAAGVVVDVDGRTRVDEDELGEEIGGFVGIFLEGLSFKMHGVGIQLYFIHHNANNHNHNLFA